MSVGFIYGGKWDMTHDKSNETSKVADKFYHIMDYQMHLDAYNNNTIAATKIINNL